MLTAKILQHDAYLVLRNVLAIRTFSVKDFLQNILEKKNVFNQQTQQLCVTLFILKTVVQGHSQPLEESSLSLLPHS